MKRASQAYLTISRPGPEDPRAANAVTAPPSFLPTGPAIIDRSHKDGSGKDRQAEAAFLVNSSRHQAALRKDPT